MKRPVLSLIGRCLIAAAVLGSSLSAIAKEPKKLLVVTVTKGFRHSSIATAEKVLGQIAERDGTFTVDFARNDEDIAAKMTTQKLKQYDGFIFANTTGILPLPDKQAFLDAIKGGKGFIGMHSASDTFHAKDGIDPYIEMLGGEFKSHGAQAAVECAVHDEKHPSTRHLGEKYKVEGEKPKQDKEEIYLFKSFDRTKVHELLSLDKHPNDNTPGYFPIAWSKKYGKGNVFYTALGHNEFIWESEKFQKHILGGIKWAVDLEKGSGKPQATKKNAKKAEKEEAK